MKIIKKVIIILTIANFSFANEAKICIIQTAAHPALDKTYDGIVDVLRLEKKFEISSANAQGDVNLSNQIAEKCASQNQDAIVSIGTLASQSAANSSKSKNIPIVFASVTDPNAAGLKEEKLNITGVSNFIILDEQLEVFKEILPNMSKLGFIYNPGEINSVKILEYLTSISDKYGIEIIKSTANKTAEISSAANKLVGKVDAIFISNDNTALAAFGVIAKIAYNNKIPLFTSDTDLVANGALASLGPNQYNLGQQAGKLLLKVVQNKNAKIFPIEYPQNIELAVNKKLAQHLGITFSQKLLNRAK